MAKLGFFENASVNAEKLVTTLVATKPIETTFSKTVLQKIIDHAKAKHIEIIKQGASSLKLGDLVPSAKEIDAFIVASCSQHGALNVDDYAAAIKRISSFSLAKSDVSTAFSSADTERLALSCHTSVRLYYREHPNIVEEHKAEQEEPALQAGSTAP